jgi:hypothetical protein
VELEAFALTTFTLKQLIGVERSLSQGPLNTTSPPLFGQFGNEEVTAVGGELDAELERSLQHAAE